MSSYLAPPVVCGKDVESLSDASSILTLAADDDISEKRCSVLTVNSHQTAVEVSRQPELVCFQVIGFISYRPRQRRSRSPAGSIADMPHQGYVEWTG